MGVKIAASILGADMTDMRKLVKSVESSGSDWLHYDVMDGVFVPNISFGIPVLRDISKCGDIYKDVHLMIEDPIKYIKQFKEAGADMITFHLESKSDPKETVKAIHSAGAQAGIAIKPGTDVKKVLPFADSVDMILVMTVEPGFGGQKFMPDMMKKAETLKEYREKNNLDYLIQVDGGINAETAKTAVKSGVDVLVAGSFLMKAEDMKKAVDTIRVN